MMPWLLWGDIGTVRKTFKDPDGFARVNGRPAVVLEVTKRTGENIIETIDRVRDVVQTEPTILAGGRSGALCSGQNLIIYVIWSMNCKIILFLLFSL